MKKLLTLAIVAAFLSIVSVGCNKDTKSSGAAGGSGGMKPASGASGAAK